MIESCRKLTMDKFIECLVNKNYSVLGEGTDEQLLTAWEKLWSEYLELDKSDQYELILNSLKDYNYYRSAIASIEIAVYVMEYQYDSKCADVLRKFGFNYDYETKDRLKYFEILNTCKTRIKSFVFSFEMAKNKYLELTENTQRKEIKETDFDNIFASMSKFMGQIIRPSAIMVTEYIAIKKLMSKNG